MTVKFDTIPTEAIALWITSIIWALDLSLSESYVIEVLRLFMLMTDVLFSQCSVLNSYLVTAIKDYTSLPISLKNENKYISFIKKLKQHLLE